MNQKSKESLRQYVLTTKTKLNALVGRASHKRKTDKWKACLATCKIFLLRIESTHGCLTSWGLGEDMVVGDETILSMLYDPIISFWTNELNK